MAAAKRIFGLLPVDQRDEMLALWLEFEQRETLESRYAAAMDRIQPLLHNYFTGEKRGRNTELRQTASGRGSFLQEDLPDLYSLVQHLIDDAVKQGYLRP